MKIVDDTPLISVIVPVYNVELYLEKCVHSILNQTYKNLEIILINDGSADNSGAICEQFKESYSNIVVFHQKNSGQSTARNLGLDSCNGAYVIFVDSDDWLKKEMIASLLYFALENNLKLVECGIIKSQDLKNSQNKTKASKQIENQAEAMARLLNDNNFSVWRRIYDIDMIKNRRFIPNKINEDVFFTIDSINSIKKQGYIQDELYIYNTENLSTTRSPYSLTKLDAKDALYHIVENTKSYDIEVRTIANQYLLRGLINHYNPLFSHAHLDPKFEHRRKLKIEINTQILKMQDQKIPNGLPSWEKTFLKLPMKLYGLYVLTNQLRLKIRIIIFKNLNV